jgi:hypothetical protein
MRENQVQIFAEGIISPKIIKILQFWSIYTGEFAPDAGLLKIFIKILQILPRIFLQKP